MTLTYKHRDCAECGASFQPRRSDEFFCSIPCRKNFDNRAMARGRDLYHLFMTLRYDRGLAKAMNVWSILCRMCETWRAEDHRERAGRPSWSHPKRILDKLPVVMVAKDVYVGRENFGRKAIGR